jgi:uncharacterized membrane protein YdbT with pleckstrin-like domain
MANFNIQGIPFKPSRKELLSRLFVPALIGAIFYSLSLMIENLLTGFYISNIVSIIIFIVIFIVALANIVDIHITSYIINEKGIEIKQEFIKKVSKKVPYRNIQNMYVEQHLPDRLLDIGKIIIETASSLKEEKDRIELFGIEKPFLLSELIEEEIHKISGKSDGSIAMKNEIEKIKESIEKINSKVNANKEEIEKLKEEIKEIKNFIENLSILKRKKS